MESARVWVFSGFLGLAVGVGCVHTKAGTHVEVIEMDGRAAYISGAAGVGKSKTASCRMAIVRAAKAVAHRFAQEREDLGEELAEELEAEEGGALLYEYVNHAILSAPVEDITYNPMDHSCLATVRWQPPVFLKKAVQQFAGRLGEAEANQSAGSAPEVVEPLSAGAPEVVSPQAGGAEASPSPGAAPEAPCQEQGKAVLRAMEGQSKRERDFEECKRRTDGDEQVCYRYGLYVEKESVKVDVAKKALERCRELLR